MHRHTTRATSARSDATGRRMMRRRCAGASSDGIRADSSYRRSHPKTAPSSHCIHELTDRPSTAATLKVVFVGATKAGDRQEACPTARDKQLVPALKLRAGGSGGEDCSACSTRSTQALPLEGGADAVRLGEPRQRGPVSAAQIRTVARVQYQSGNRWSSCLDRGAKLLQRGGTGAASSSAS